MASSPLASSRSSGFLNKAVFLASTPHLGPTGLACSKQSELGLRWGSECLQSPAGESTQVWLSSCVCIFSPWVATLETDFHIYLYGSTSSQGLYCQLPQCLRTSQLYILNTKITWRTTSPHHTRQQSEGRGGGPPSTENAAALLQVFFPSPSQVFVSAAENGPLRRLFLLGPFLTPGSLRGWGQGGVKC